MYKLKVTTHTANNELLSLSVVTATAQLRTTAPFSCSVAAKQCVTFISY